MAKEKKILLASLSLLASFSMAMPNIEKTVKADETTAKGVNPIAKYEFQDASNPGKDSMGNYDLEVKAHDGLTEGTVAVENGVATFNRTAGLRAADKAADLADDVKGEYSFAFEVKNENTHTSWASPGGIGWNGWDATSWATFQYASGSDLLRFSSASELVEGKSNVDGNANPYWGKEIGKTSDDFHKVLLTSKPGEKVRVYFDGNLVYDYDCPANYTTADSSSRFALGGESCWGNIYNGFYGQLKNVEVYDFAFTQAQAIAYGINGYLTEADIAEQELINAIAKYDFNDETNPGKDSMGNYNLEVKAHDGLTEGTVTVENGVATFNRTAGLRAADNVADLADDVKGEYSFAFEVKNENTHTSWASPGGIGWNGWDATSWATFQYSSGSDLLRFSTASELVEGKSNVDGNTNAFWGKEIGHTSDDFHKVLLTSKPGEKVRVYFDGNLVYDYACPANYTTADGSSRFALGGESCWGNIYNGFYGQLKNVRVYDFAMNTVQVAQYTKLGEIYRGLDSKVKTAKVDLSNNIVIPANLTPTQMLAYAPAESTIEVIMTNDTTKEAKATWNNVVTIEGETYLEGTLSGVINTDNVKAYAKISLDENAKSLLPIAKYEFQDATNPGKDSMGNYDLVVAESSEATEKGTVKVENGIATFDGTAALISKTEENDLSEVLNSFTLSFDIKTTATYGSWAEPIGFGWDNWDASKWCLFEFASGSDLLRFTACSAKDENTGFSNVDGNPNQWWGKEVAYLGTSDFHNVVLSFEVGGKAIIYVDGVVKYSYDVPANYTLSSATAQFAIGGNGTFGDARNFFIGDMANVSVYDFAVSAEQARVLGVTNDLTTTIVSGTYISKIDANPVFTGDKTTCEITSKMSTEEILGAMNTATVKATLSDNTTKELNVVWEDVIVNGDEATVTGYASVINAGLTTVKKATVTTTVDVKVIKDEPSIDQSEEPSEVPSEVPSTTPSETPSETISEVPSTTPSETASESGSEDGNPSDNKPTKKGCKGAMASSMIGLLAIAGMLIVSKKRK